MQTLLLHNLQQLGGYGEKRFIESERLLYLNLALYRLISQKFTGNNPIQQGFEESSKRMADLGILTTARKGLTAVSEPSATSITNGKQYELPSDSAEAFLFYIYSQTYLDRGNEGTSKWVGNKLIQHEDLHEYIENDINNPIIKEPLILFIEGRLMIIHGPDDVVNDVELFYIRKPTAITSSTGEYTDMPAHTHYEIVELATSIIKERTERQSYATSLEESKRTE